MKPQRWLFEKRYLVGQTPWDSGVTPPEVTQWLEERKGEAGRALDLGCGTGTNALYLARQGWDVVGVDFSLLAIWQARWKAWRAGVDVDFHHADVSRLDFLTTPCDLVLDIGCLHSLPEERRSSYAAGVARLLRPGGWYLLYAFLPHEEWGGGQGITPQDVRRLFDATLVLRRQEGGEDPTGPSSAWYWMQRKREEGGQDDPVIVQGGDL